MATTANVPTKPLSIIPAALTKNGTFFRNQYIIVFDPYLSSNPFPIHPDDAILAGLNNYCDFTLLNNLPADFDIQYDTKLDKWVQLVNPPPHTNIILIETMRNITSQLIYKVIMEASNIPISSSDLIFHPRLGVGIAQGIINQLGHYLQILISFRNHGDTGGLVTFVAVWIHYTRVSIHTGALEFIQNSMNGPVTDFDLINDSLIRLTDTKYQVDVVFTTMMST
ncbi:hypothetical protein PC9H_008859 [Pleurotus ostreatus]|uniref:Uncharacterized protein n=1 Tax=Pleurotus ostreatus TaxID=5322 RepID=A0A8H6ZWL4_PLEOS|nr:uncharacterized protein PC9H_008859 [Pleurotus ostreatus]KAF7426490.1 hypothetical protein PC9H_008859 [Pleurotus ostreatus]KAJ8694046.1 hypothetical protein PTI98_008979 [Pleurotus ostreatus]